MPGRSVSPPKLKLPPPLKLPQAALPLPEEADASYSNPRGQWRGVAELMTLYLALFGQVTIPLHL